MTKEPHALYMKNYYKSHPEQVERHKINGREYRRGKGRFKEAKNKALKRGLVWNLTEQEFYSLIVSAKCHYCNGELPQTSCGLDRKDNSQGYYLSNVVPCCHDCNTMKSSRISYNEMTLIWTLRKGV